MPLTPQGWIFAPGCAQTSDSHPILVGTGLDAGFAALRAFTTKAAILKSLAASPSSTAVGSGVRCEAQVLQWGGGQSGAAIQAQHMHVAAHAPHTHLDGGTRFTSGAWWLMHAPTAACTLVACLRRASCWWARACRQRGAMSSSAMSSCTMRAKRRSEWIPKHGPCRSWAVGAAASATLRAGITMPAWLRA